MTRQRERAVTRQSRRSPRSRRQGDGYKRPPLSSDLARQHPAPIRRTSKSRCAVSSVHGVRGKTAMRSGDSGPAVTSPVPREVWESVLRADLNAVVAQSLSWRDAVFASGLYRDLSLLYEFPSGRQVVLPMARHRGAPSWAAWQRLGRGGGKRPGRSAREGESARKRRPQCLLTWRAEGRWPRKSSLGTMPTRPG